MHSASISLPGALFLALITAQPRLAQSQQPRPAPPSEGAATEIAFSQLLRSGLAEGRYRVRCVILAVQGPNCPPCPPKVACSPCPPVVYFRIGPTAPGQMADTSLAVDATGGFAEARSLSTGLAYLLTLDVSASGPPYRPRIVSATPLR